MFRWILRRFGYYKIDYGYACGRYWIEIDGKQVAQTPESAVYLSNENVRKLGSGVIEGCVWKIPVYEHEY